MIWKPSGIDRLKKRLRPSSAPAKTFHLFPKLPPELRIIIWISSLQPRLVYLYNPHRTISPTKDFLSYAPCPPILHVSREARYIALQHYTAYQSVSKLIVPWNYYFNPSLDILSYPYYGLDGFIITWPPVTEIDALTHNLIPPPPSPDPENYLIIPRPTPWLSSAQRLEQIRVFREALPKLKTLLVCVDDDASEGMIGGATGVRDMTREELDGVPEKMVEYLGRIVPVLTAPVGGGERVVVRMVKFSMLPRKKKGLLGR